MWFSLKRKPCAELLAVFVFGPQYCGTLTRRRRRIRRNFSPICHSCIQEFGSLINSEEEQ